MGSAGPSKVTLAINNTVLATYKILWQILSSLPLTAEKRCHVPSQGYACLYPSFTRFLSCLGSEGEYDRVDPLLPSPTPKDKDKKIPF